MTTTGKRRRYPTADSINEFDDDNEEVLNSNSDLTNKRRGSATADLTSHRLIVSERQQLAVLKQLTAGDESNSGSLSSCSGGTQQQRPTKIHRRNEHGETILHTSARKGDLKQLKKALKDNANVNEEDNAGWTPLHEAVTKNQFKAARLLLKSGANANAPGPERQTPLVDAVLNNNTKMVELLLNYSADTSVVDFSRLNEPMIKVLKREITTLDVSDNENDEDSLSPSSPMTSIDDSEHEEEKIDKNLVQSSSSSYISKKPFHHFHEYSSDSIANNKTYTVFNDLSRKNPYDFESDDDDDNDDDDDERIGNSKQRTASGTSNDSNDIKNSIHSFKEQLPFNNENIHRVPPLKIVLARTISHKNTDTESNNSSTMDDNSLMETLSLPIIEQNEKFLSTVITSSDFNNKVMTLGKKQDENILLSTDEKSSIVSSINELQKQSTHMIISTLLNDIITQIDPTTSIPLTLLKTNEIIQREKQNELKITTRTLRSHAKGKLNTLISNQCSNDYRRVSNRRRIFDKNINERFQRKKTLSEPSQHSETSSNFDDQTSENLHGKTESMDATNTTSNDGTSSIVHNHSDMDLLPTDKRRLREKNTGLLNSTEGSTTINSSSTEENVSIETITRDIPVNGIKQFLEIRQQIDKRHEAMLHDFVPPKVPKDFAETMMAKKTYLIAPSLKSCSITTPASLGIKRLNPPSDLDMHLLDIFTRQEDERYRMRLRHQVEREKLILSHEQDILRLYGNAERSSINQDIPFSYCSLLKDNEVYNNPSVQERQSSFINNEYINTELGKRGKHRGSGRSIIKWLEDSNLKYKRLSCEINQRQQLESNTLHSMQRMVWLKHIPKENSLSGRINSLLSERYLPKVHINTNFWTHWETSPV